jgi:predicted nucleotidyltransferase
MTSSHLFKYDFINSDLLTTLLTDVSAEPILVFLTGSALTGLADSGSDFDICVLTKDPIKANHTLAYRPKENYAVHRPTGKKCHWVYNTLSQINAPSEILLDNIGWAQFKYLTEDTILYCNPKYVTVVKYLFDCRNKIVLNSIYLALVSCCHLLNIDAIVDISDKYFYNVKKLAYHLCWLYNELVLADQISGTLFSNEFISRIKRMPFEELTTHEQQNILSIPPALSVFYKNYTFIPVPLDFDI